MVAGLVVRQHGVRVGLALGGVRGRDGVDDGLGLLVADLCEAEALRQTRASPGGGTCTGWRRLTLIVVYDIAEMVLSTVVCSAHAHGVVREVDIAVVACLIARSVGGSGACLDARGAGEDSQKTVAC